MIIYILMNISIIKRTHKFIESYVCYTKSLPPKLLTQNNNMKLWKWENEPKAPPTTPYRLEKKWMNHWHNSFTFIKHVHSSITNQQYYDTYYPFRTIILPMNKSLNYLKFFSPNLIKLI